MTHSSNSEAARRSAGVAAKADPERPTIKPLALTMGEPAGIGPDITLSAWQSRRDYALPVFCVLGSPRVFEARARTLDVNVPVKPVDTLEDVHKVFETALPVLTIDDDYDSTPGTPSVAAAPTVINAIERAVELIAQRQACGVVTNPIAKKVLYDAGFAFPGHTEFLAHLAGKHWAGKHTPVMMLASDVLKVVPVTVHIPLGKVVSALKSELIVTTAKITARSLAHEFGIAKPRLALAGLNPHAGEDGTLGTEDRDIVAPAIKRLRDEGFVVTGPHPADTMFHAAARKTYDAALAMYHDQALVPIKTLAFERAVNVTLGLPFVRTSPDHGTAFDIAGKGTAQPESLIAAIRLAGELAARRQMATA